MTRIKKTSFLYRACAVLRAMETEHMTNVEFAARASCDRMASLRLLDELQRSGLIHVTGIVCKNRNWLNVYAFGPGQNGRVARAPASRPTLLCVIFRMVLQRIVEGGGPSVRELAEETGATQRTVLGYVNALRAAGLVYYVYPSYERERTRLPQIYFGTDMQDVRAKPRTQHQRAKKYRTLLVKESAQRSAKRSLNTIAAVFASPSTAVV